MRAVFIIPTGIGCKFGGHAGDATPALKLIAEVCDEVVTHPNVVNASDINEMPSNCLYVEGEMLDQYLNGWLSLDRRRHSNSILVAVNDPVQPETINAVNAARTILGARIEIVVLKKRLQMFAYLNENGASGEVHGVDELIAQVQAYDFDALAIATQINYETEKQFEYFRSGHVNPWGRVEAMVSGKVSKALHKPCAHAPIESSDLTVRMFNEVVDPCKGAEMVSLAYLHCVLKGLHKAPRLWTAAEQMPSEVDVLVSPVCYGAPHKICEARGIPVIYVESNTTVQRIEHERHGIFAKNYLEAAGYIAAMKAGLTTESVMERPFEQVKIHGT